MKKFLLAALLAAPALGLVSESAEAGGWCRGPYCGEGRNGGIPPWGVDLYRVWPRDTFVNDRPWPSWGTDIYLRRGSVVRAKCFSNRSGRWCKIKSGVAANMFVQELCLQPYYGWNGYDGDTYRPGYKSYYYNGNGNYRNGYNDGYNDKYDYNDEYYYKKKSYYYKEKDYNGYNGNGYNRNGYSDYKDYNGYNGGEGDDY